MALNLGMTVDLCMAYLLMNVSMSLTLTLIQGHIGSVEENNVTAHDGRLMHDIYAHVRLDDLDLVLDFENVCKARPTCFK